MQDKYEFVIVGAGAGGASLAKELAQRGKRVLVIERGDGRNRLGSARHALRYYDRNGLFGGIRKSREGVVLWRALMAGGTTVISCGNAIRSLQKPLLDLGIRLDDEFAEVDKELGVGVPDADIICDGSHKILEASKALGYRMELTPKLIDFGRCTRCGQCVLGCTDGAKWTAMTPLGEAQRHGAEILYGTRVLQVIRKAGKACGVIAVSGEGRQEIAAETVILAAGGLATPVILQRSGVRSGRHGGQTGSGLFCDLLVNTYGVARDVEFIREPTMTLFDGEFHEEEGLILSTFANQSWLGRIMEMGIAGVRLPTRGLMGIMTKIADEATGCVNPDGTVSKRVSPADQKKLSKGVEISTEILIKAECKPSSIIVSRPQGAHPGGTAAIGRVVDADLQTEVDNLFVCDASVLPIAPGLPPILTIVALAKRLGKKLAGTKSDKGYGTSDK